MTEQRATYTTTADADADQLRQQVVRVQSLRLAYQQLRERRDEVYERFEAEHRALFDELERAFTQLEAESSRLREMALAAYAATGSKQPTMGVGIRVVTKVLYDDQQALDWALEHRMALALDRRAFERIARADPWAVRGIATLAQEATATIAADLAPFAPEAVAAEFGAPAQPPD